MIKVSGQFFFSYCNDNSADIYRILMRFNEQCKREAVTSTFYINNIKENWFPQSCQEKPYFVDVKMTLHIDESYYSLQYEEHEIKTFIKRYLKYNLDMYGLEFMYIEDIDIRADSFGVKRNNIYDNYCEIQSEHVKPIKQIKKNDQESTNEKVGSKRRVYILDEEE